MMINILMRYEDGNTIPVMNGAKMRQFKKFGEAEKYVEMHFRYELTAIYIDTNRQIVVDGSE